MSISLTEFKTTVLNQLLDFLWRQWSALGVAGQGAPEERRVIDPEPLLLLSLTVCRYDARLFDEVLDWLTVNGANLRAQRAYAACGFVEEGRQRQQIWSGGAYDDLVLMGVLRSEWTKGVAKQEPRSELQHS